MPTTVKTGWLKDKNGDKFAPKTLTSDANGLYVGDSTQSSSGTNLSHTFTANANEGYWTVLMLDVRTAGNTTTFSNISLVKN